ncbi:MAG TPA: two-component regulator propeller domain-containing protein [Candidatus Kapabacteria bacterium]|nr:two-component regulator propeller domain-containing protein [Candidatus Kapabacteria bacterium]
MAVVLQSMPIRDRGGRLWFATGSGLTAVSKTGVDIVTWRHDPDDSTTLSARRIRGVAFDRRGVLWVGTDYGLNRYDRATGKWRRFYETSRSSLTHSTVNVIFRDRDGSMLFGTNSGLSTLDHSGNPISASIPGLPREVQDRLHVWSILRDRAGRLWIGTAIAGIHVLDPAGNPIHHYQHDPTDDGSLSAGGVWSLIEDRHGNIWAGTNEGLSRWLPKSNRFSRYEHQPGNARSLGGKRIWSLFEDSSAELWVCSYGGGISRYNRTTDDFSTITTRDGLVSNAVVGILEDANRDFWIATTKGLVRWDRRRNTFRLFDERDGLQGNEFAFHAFTSSPDGRLYFGGVNGLSAFSPESMGLDRTVPPIVVAEFRVFDSVTAPELVDGDTVRLSHDQNSISFEFAALSYINPGKNEYGFRLVGLEDEWIRRSSTNRIASYTRLRPGTYTFLVRGSNGDGVWNERGASITVVIAPPWWGTWAFRTAAAVALLTSLIVGNRVRTDSIRRREREKQEASLIAALESQEVERQRIARDLHDGVGQLIAAAAVNVGYVREMMRQHVLGSLESELDGAMQRSLSILWQASTDVRAISRALGTTSLKEFGLVATITELLRNLDPCQQTRFEFETLGMEERLPENLEVGLFRVAQELITNVVRHSGATEATLQIVHEHGEVRLTVEDNGTGFDSAHRNGGMGRQNIEARVALMDGTVDYDSTPGHGTTIMVTVPCRE